MTSEEAAEVLLLGPQWHGCTQCDALGYVACKITVGSPIVLLSNGQVASRSPCVSCFGCGYLLDDEYIRACILHNVPVPKGRDHYVVHEYGHAVEEPRLQSKSDGTKVVNVQVKDADYVKTFRVAYESR